MTIHHESTLHEWVSVSPLAIHEFLDISVMITEMVYNIHKQNETIGALSPKNIKIRAQLKQAVVTDTTKWSAAYRPPEYSGMMNRVPDARSDLYSLGVIFYELLTGQLPIQPENAEGDWEFAHVVEHPQLLQMYRSELEGPLQTIVMKLLAKSPDARYQSAYGLLADLKLCASHLEKYGILQPIDIGRVDQRSRFRQTSMPIGRENVLLNLEIAYSQAVQGSSVSVNVSGEEGTGKSLFIAHYASTLRARGVQVMTAVCCAGDQCLPYAPILQAIGQGLEQLWCEDTETKAMVTSYLERELGHNVAHIQSILPEAAELLGLASNKTIVPSLNESQTKEALLAVLRSFTTYCKPLVLWLDHLDQADSGTLDLLNCLSQQQLRSGMLLIGTQQAGMESGYVCTKHTKLEPFVYEDVRQWMVATVHEDSMRVRVLARWVFDLTSGNPGAIYKLLQQWTVQKKLIFDEVQQRWTWDQVMNEMENEVSSQTHRLYEEGLQRLDERTKQLLIIASVCGIRFNSLIVSEISECSHSLTLTLLEYAEREGLIYCDDEEKEAISGEQGRNYLFMHTQLSSLLYEQIEGSQEHWHYKFGQMYRNRLTSTSSEELLRVTDHWNQCSTLLSMDEQRELAQWNTQMCVRMNKKRNYLKAKFYAEAAIQLMEQIGEPISSRFRCYTELAYSEYMRGDLERMRAHFQYLMQHINELGQRERINLAIYQIEMFTFENNAEAIRNGQIALAEYGWQLPKRASVWTLLSEVVRTQLVIRRNRDKLFELPSNKDADYELVNRLFLIVGVPLLSERPIEHIVFSARFIRYGLGQGMNEFFFCNIGLYELVLQRGAPWLYRLLPTEVLRLLQTSSLAHEAHQYRLPVAFALSTQLEQPSASTDYLTKSMRRSMEYGDVTMVNLSITVILITYYGNVHGLMELLSSIELEAQHMIDEKTLDLLNLTKAYGEALRDERAQLQYIKPARPDSQHKEDNYTCICKLEVAYYAGQYREALDWARRGRAIELKFDWMENRKLRLFEALSGAALYPNATSDERRGIVRMLRKLMRQMKRWSGFWGYQSSAYLLIVAEWICITGKGQAISAYEAAIEKAKEEQYPLMEAIAGERLYHYYEQTGRTSGAVVFLMDACTAYFNWGLLSKVNAVKRQYPDLWWYTFSGHESVQLEIAPESGLKRTKAIAKPDKQPRADVDILSQIVQWSDFKQEELLVNFLETAIRQLGADRGCILTCKGQQYEVQLEAGHRSARTDEAAYPIYVCRYVQTTGRYVLVEDVAQSPYMRDPYMARYAPCSIICMRVGKPYEGADWLLYLENSQITGVFTEQSLHVLELMITRLSYLYWIQHDHTMNPSERPAPVDASLEPEPINPLIGTLTPRESEVLQALVAGLSNKEIAEHLGISEDTVKKHLFNLYGKLGIKRRTQAIARAKELNLL